MDRGTISLREQELRARRAAAREAVAERSTPGLHFTEALALARDAAGHEHWTGNTHTTDLLVQAQRSATWRGTCSDPKCVRPDHQRS
jgi:hypothetical protein